MKQVTLDLKAIAKMWGIDTVYMQAQIKGDKLTITGWNSGKPAQS